MPLLRSFSHLGNFSTKISLLAELERADNLRKIPKFSFGEFGLRCVMELVKFAGGGIALHLPVPIIVLERVQQCLQLATLLQRKLFNRVENFSNRAHAGKLSTMRFGVNKPNPKRKIHFNRFSSWSYSACVPIQNQTIKFPLRRPSVR